MPYRVEISDKALDDIDALYLTLADSGAAAAAGWFNGLVAAILSLAEFPSRCPMLEETSSTRLEVRFLQYGKRRSARRIIFLVESDVVTILRVRHSAEARLRVQEFLQE